MSLWDRIKRYFTADAWLERHGIFYRRVVKYEPGEQGELATLECGHQLYMMPAPRRAMLPCSVCARGESPDAK